MDFTPENVERVINNMSKIGLKPERDMWFSDFNGTYEQTELFLQLRSHFGHKYSVTMMVCDKFMIHKIKQSSLITINDNLLIGIREVFTNSGLYISITVRFSNTFERLSVYFTVSGGDFVLINKQIQRMFMKPNVRVIEEMKEIGLQFHRIVYSIYPSEVANHIKTNYHTTNIYKQRNELVFIRKHNLHVVSKNDGIHLETSDMFIHILEAKTDTNAYTWVIAELKDKEDKMSFLDFISENTNIDEICDKIVSFYRNE